MNQDYNKLNKRFKTILIVSGLLLVLCSFWAGRSSGRSIERNYYKNEIERLSDSVKFSENKVLVLESEILCLQAEDKIDEEVQEDNYNNYLNEKHNEKQIQDDINSIVHREYSKSYLDSLARNVRFN